MSGTALATSDKNLFYCSVPKVGCTYWKRVIRFIGNDYKGHFKSPESIPRLFVHEGPYQNTTVILLKNETTMDNLDYRYTFMFARDPYERLWSGYLDKLYLPDFWWWLGIQITNNTRPNADIRSVKCGDDVTFEEFLSYMVVNLQNGVRVDNHFAPIYTQCNPCAIRFDIIGKLETFEEDSRLILEETNTILSNGHTDSNKDLVLEEVQSLLKYNFDVLEKLKKSSGSPECYHSVSIAKRLWKTFQFHGYVSDKHMFPTSMMNYANDLMILRKALLKQIIYLRQSAGNEVETWKAQRQRYLNLAYSAISQKVLNAIGQTYKGDFELFNYKKRTFH